MLWVIKVSCHHRRYEEGTSENEAVAEEEEEEEEEEEGEEEASPDMDGCPAIKVGRAGTWEGLFWGK